MNAPPAPATRSSSAVLTLPGDEDLGLAELLDLFAPEGAAAVPASSSFRADATRLWGWVRHGVRRATAWGSGPGGAWRAW